MNELFAAVSKMQGELRGAIKDSKNPFFKSNYADLGSHWDSARELLAKYGLCLIQTTQVQGPDVILKTTLGHSSGQFIESFYPINPVKNDPQAMGSAYSYARRYSFSAIIGTCQVDDDDGQAASHPTPQPTYIEKHPQPVLNGAIPGLVIPTVGQPQSPVKTNPSASGITDKQRKMIWAKTKGLGFTDDGAKELFVKHSGKEHSADWTRQDFDRILNALDAIAASNPQNELLS